MMTLRAMLSSALLACPALLAGQEPAAETFHRGQWGADVFISGGFGGAGVLKFTSPSRAWVIDGFGFVRSDKTSPPQGFTGSTTRYANFTARFGRRRYKPMASRVLGTLTVGVSASYANTRTDNSGTALSLRSLGGGLFGELGGQWMVTPHLSLGATWGLALNYATQKQSQAGFGDVKITSVQLAFGGVGLRGAFYF